MYAKRLLRPSTQTIVFSSVAVFALILSLPAQLQAQQPVEKIPVPPVDKKLMPPVEKKPEPPKEQPDPWSQLLIRPEIAARLRAAGVDRKPLTPAQLEVLAKITKRLVAVEDGDDELRKLLKERVKMALAQYALTRAREDIVPDKSAWLDTLITAHRKAVETALELLTSPEEQALILESLLWAAIDVEQNFKDRVDRFLALPQDYYGVRGYRLDVEIALVKVKRKIKSEK
jgi:hypothetical protein